MANHFDFVVEFLDRAVIDGHVETGQDVLFMATNHPGKLGQKFRTSGKWFLKMD